MKNENLKIGLLYFFLFAGGLWQILGFFTATMEILASPIIIVISILCFWESLNVQISKSKFWIWSILVVLLSFFVEFVGVKTGKIFGVYNYGEVLQPQISNVPIAIGFAWLLMLLSSITVWQKLNEKLQIKNIFLVSIFISILMVIFDFFMEPAAIKLDYWKWEMLSVPIQNYLAWFLISYFFVVLGFYFSIFEKSQPSFVFHTFFAQLIYFGMVILK